MIIIVTIIFLPSQSPRRALGPRNPYIGLYPVYVSTFCFYTLKS
jgi:hypothetical protein